VSLAASEHGVTVIAGSIRNARAVSEAALKSGGPIAVIAAGEHWETSGLLRPSLEDLVGAGAIISALGGEASPEARAAAAAYVALSGDLVGVLTCCSSGRELITYGFESDVSWSSKLNVSETVPILRRGAFVSRDGRTEFASS
jgi:2-phosphosulfolactate phosphatase